MKTVKAVVLGVMALGALLASGPVRSSEGEGPGKASVGTPVLTMEEAIKTAIETYPGRVIEAEFERENGKGVYEVKVVGQTGETKTLKIDTDSGRVAQARSEEKEEGEEHEDEKEGADDVRKSREG
jgi:hypothetical protein